MEHDPNQPPIDDLENYLRDMEIAPIDPEVLEVLRKFPVTGALANGQPEPQQPPVAAAPKTSYVHAYSLATWLNIEPESPHPIVTELFDKGDKILLCGQSKTRKSFFALQMALSLASGRGFLGFPALEPIKVLIVQSEIKPNRYHMRCRRMAERFEITPNDLGDRIYVVNTRGLDPQKQLETLREKVLKYAPDLVICDPFYKLITGDESKSDDVKPILAWFDNLAEQLGCAIMYIHHDKKGISGDQQLTDRGSGTGILARDFDSAIFLAPHKDKNETLVVEFLSRNYRSPDPFSVEWLDYGFYASDIEPKKKTSRSASRERKDTLAEMVEKARKVIVACYMAGETNQLASIFRLKLEEGGVRRNALGAVIDCLVEQEFINIERKGFRKNVTLFGKCLGDDPKETVLEENETLF